MRVPGSPSRTAATRSLITALSSSPLPSAAVSLATAATCAMSAPPGLATIMAHAGRSETGPHKLSGRACSLAGTVSDRLIVRGAREHNLRDVSLDLPRDAL